ncbi:MAG: hypothetical protein FWD72_04325, partial [Eggerthellaceae bacterium]|nr:hypothetical protein [Eggerthellaceae bacterium]
MIHVFNIIAIVGFALSAVLLIAAAVIYQTKKIRQVRDDLTGKTAARSIAEIRLRAKKHKHTTTQAAKRYGWEKDEIPSGALSSFARIGGTAAGPASARTGGGAGRGDEHVQTSVLAKGSGDEYAQTTELASGSDDDEYSQTTVLADAASGDELNQTTVLVGEQGEEGTQTTVLAPDGGEVLQPSLKKKAAHLPPQTGALVVLLLAACVFAATSFAWGEEGAAAAGQAQEEGSPDGGEGALGAGSAADGQPTAGSADASQPQTGDQENAPGTGEANGQNAPMGVQGLSSPVAPMAATTFYFPNAVSLRRGPTTLAPPVTIVNGEPCMWLGAADLSSTVTLRSTPNGALSFYPTSDPNFDPNTINWAIVPSIPSIASTDTFPIYIYVMANTTLSLTLGETQLTDPNATTGAVIPAGTVFILPILCYDKESPAIT